MIGRMCKVDTEHGPHMPFILSYRPIVHEYVIQVDMYASPYKLPKVAIH